MTATTIPDDREKIEDELLSNQEIVIDEDLQVDLTLIKNGVTRIRIKEPTCIIQHDKKGEIIFDLDEQQIITVNNFGKLAEELKLDKRLSDAIISRFISKYYRIKEANSSVPFKVRRVLPDQDYKRSWPREPEGYYQEVKIAECIRMHEGKVKVIGGMISGTSTPDKWISGIRLVCGNCNDMYEVIGNERPVSIHEVFRIKEWGKCPRYAEKLKFRGEQDLIKINALQIELQDVDTVDALEGVQVVLFDKDTDKVTGSIGEQVIITGSVFNIIFRKKYVTFILADSIDT